MVANINSSVPLCRHSVCVCVYEFPVIVWLYGCMDGVHTEYVLNLYFGQYNGRLLFSF